MTVTAKRPAGRLPFDVRAWRPEPSDAAFAGLLVLGAVLILAFTRGLSLFADDWEIVVHRPGLSPGALLTPHGPHLSLIPILIYKLLLHGFGGRSYLPFRLLSVFDLLLLATVLGLFARARWGRWWGLVPVALLVTMGPGGESLLWSFQCGYAIAVAAGFVALLNINRGGRRSDLLACGALIVSLASASQGIGLTAGAAVMLALRPGWNRRAWIVLVPAALYALWYLRYGHQYSESQLSLWTTSLSYEVQSLSATLGPVFGLGTVSAAGVDTTYGAPLALAALGAVAFFLVRGWRPPPLFWGAAVTLAVLWFAASLSNFAWHTRPPNTSRYVSSNVFLVLACVLVAVPKPKLALRGGVAVAVTVILAIICATNASDYSVERGFMNNTGNASRAELGGLLVMRGAVSPAFVPATPGDRSVLVWVTAQNFFSAYDSFGLPGYSVSQLNHLDEGTRRYVDQELARGELSLSKLTTAASPAAPSTNCRPVGSSPAIITAHPGRIELFGSRSAPMTVSARRFGSTNSVSVGTIPAGVTDVLPIPHDHAPGTPWRIQVSGAGGRVCTTRQ
ncbi:MAG: hypothetical protein ACYDHH_00515 [Solirubrobacteraceae bacterium]